MVKEVKVGMKFGHLEVIDPREQGKKRKSWLCLCDCGKYVIKGSQQLLGTPTRRPEKSCGCSQYVHGGKVIGNERIYGTWHLMNERCYNPTADNYDRYGGKGVTVAEEWRSTNPKAFLNFLDWSLNNGYKKKLTLDRIDFNEPYSPSNCRWADYYTQNQNKGISKRNKTGIIGVSKYKYGYRMGIKRDGIMFAQAFKTIEEAKQAREKAEEYYKNNKTLKGFKV